MMSSVFGGLVLGTLLSVDYSHILCVMLEFNQRNDFFNVRYINNVINIMKNVKLFLNNIIDTQLIFKYAKTKFLSATLLFNPGSKSET